MDISSGDTQVLLAKRGAVLLALAR